MAEEKEKIKVIVDADTYLELLETKMKAKEVRSRIRILEDKLEDARSYARAFKEEKEQLENRISKAMEILEDVFCDDDEDINNIKGILDGTRVIINSADLNTSITRKESKTNE